jgi:hypothetical protein
LPLAIDTKDSKEAMNGPILQFIICSRSTMARQQKFSRAIGIFEASFDLGLKDFVDYIYVEVLIYEFAFH